MMRKVEIKTDKAPKMPFSLPQGVRAGDRGKGRDDLFAESASRRHEQQRAAFTRTTDRDPTAADVGRIDRGRSLAQRRSLRIDLESAAGAEPQVQHADLARQRNDNEREHQYQRP